MSEQIEIDKVVARCLHDLGEHFSSVQILASRVVEGNTHFKCIGVGDYYARQGMAHEFLSCNVTQDQADRIAAKLKPNEQ